MYEDEKRLAYIAGFMTVPAAVSLFALGIGVTITLRWLRGQKINPREIDVFRLADIDKILNACTWLDARSRIRIKSRLAKRGLMESEYRLDDENYTETVKVKSNPNPNYEGNFYADEDEEEGTN